MTTTNRPDFSETAPPPPSRSGGGKLHSIDDETFTFFC
jgi:hypothetical protein